MYIPLKNESILATFDLERGAFASLKGLNDGGHQQEFLLTPEEFPQLDGEDNRWLGSVRLQVVQNGTVFEWNTSDLNEARQTGWEGTTAFATYWNGAVGGLNLSEQFELETGKGGLLWTIVLENPTSEPIEVRRLGIPLMMDQYFRNDSRFKYESNVMRHTGICHHSSILYWARSNGKMPLLLLQTIGDTALDTFEREQTGKFGTVGTIEKAFEGCFTAYLYHEPVNTSHISCETLTIGPGERRTFRFRFSVCDSIQNMVEDLERNGNLAVKFLPGMVVPRGDEIKMLVRCRYPVVSESAGGVSGEAEDSNCPDQIEKLDSPDGANQCFSVSLNGYGVRELHLHYLPEDGIERTVKIQMFGTEAISEIITKHARFISENQFETDKEDPCYHGFLMWDMMTARRVNSSYNPHGADWMRGGSDEIGLVSGLFLSEKNLYQPEEGQIRILDAYVKDFIEQRLTEQPGHRVHRMVPWFQMFDDYTGLCADDIWRAFNYVHVVNTYYNMYRIAKLYHFAFLSEPEYYILQAFHYTKAMFSYWMFPQGVGATEYGNMGEMTIALFLADSLRTEGFKREADEINRLVWAKADYFGRKAYPFGSEMAYDTTAYEAVYAYGKASGNVSVMESSVYAALGNRGHQPVWYLYQTDVRQMGDSNWNDSYMTQLAAWTFYDWMFEQDHVNEELLEAWYAAYLAGWALYNSGGYWSASSENRGSSAWITVGERGHFSGVVPTPWQKDPYLYGCIACSGESSLGYFAALKIAAAVVFEHSEVGLWL